jgi:hypothetical protein
MSIIAPISKFKKNNLKIYALFCLGFAAFFAYDGYLSKYPWSHRQSFYEKHAPDGVMDGAMKFNRRAPILLAAGAIAFFIWGIAIKDKKITAEENELVIDDKQHIPFDSIQKVDKRNFDSKGYFVITYKDGSGAEVNRKISDKRYDDLGAVLERIVSKMS